MCTNIGDSRAVLCVNDTVEPLSYDHKPDDQEEKSRITNAGGQVSNGRVDGDLALSRAFGDFGFKNGRNKETLPVDKTKVIAVPDVKRIFVSDTESFPLAFVVLACDGIWDVYKNDELC